MVLVGVVVVLAVLVAVGLVLVVKAVRPLSRSGTMQAVEDSAQAAERDRQEQSLARRTGEREITMLPATAREQSADAERRQQRLDERERLLVEEAERLAERDRRITATELDLGERETSLGAREQSLTELEEQRRRELERIAGLTADGARQELIEMIETHAQTEAAL